MLKGGEIVLIALFVSAIWAVVFVLQSDTSPYYQICEPNQYTGENHCTSHHLLYVIFWYGGYVINAASIAAFATVAIAYFTLTLKRSTDKLWGITDQTLKSAERNLEATERAYIFHGYDPLQHRGNQAKLVLKMVNVGRMPGRIVEVGWKFLAQTELPPTREGRDWGWEVIPHDFIVRPGQAPMIRTFLSLEGDHVFVTYIIYEDLFSRKHHTTWMGMRIRPGEPETQAGGAAWNDWT